MIVRVCSTPYGAYIFSVSKKWTRKIVKYMSQFHKDAEAHETAFAQGDWDLPNWVRKNHRKELAKGWDVNIRVDSWIALHMWGWDAHTLAE